MRKMGLNTRTQLVFWRCRI
ncbi:hypothetical protein [Pelotomaculum terephthalicicum]